MEQCLVQMSWRWEWMHIQSWVCPLSGKARSTNSWRVSVRWSPVSCFTCQHIHHLVYGLTSWLGCFFRLRSQLEHCLSPSMAECLSNSRLSMDRNSVCPLHAAVMKSSEHPCCCSFVSSRGFLKEAFRRGGPDGSSARLMRGEITFSQVKGHFIDPLKKAFCAHMPISRTD